jgi:hypothetical protein
MSTSTTQQQSDRPPLHYTCLIKHVHFIKCHCQCHMNTTICHDLVNTTDQLAKFVTVLLKPGLKLKKYSNSISEHPVLPGHLTTIIKS